ASHLVLDAVPHFGYDPIKGKLEAPLFKVFGVLDFTASSIVTLAACLAWPHRALNILIGVIGADLPDLTYIPVVLFTRARIERWFPFYRPMLTFLTRIQWYEKPSGLITEVVWASLMLWLLQGRL